MLARPIFEDDKPIVTWARRVAALPGGGFATLADLPARDRKWLSGPNAGRMSTMPEGMADRLRACRTAAESAPDRTTDADRARIAQGLSMADPDCVAP